MKYVQYMTYFKTFGWLAIWSPNISWMINFISLALIMPLLSSSYRSNVKYSLEYHKYIIKFIIVIKILCLPNEVLAKVQKFQRETVNSKKSNWPLPLESRTRNILFENGVISNFNLTIISWISIDPESSRSILLNTEVNFFRCDFVNPSKEKQVSWTTTDILSIFELKQPITSEKYDCVFYKCISLIIDIIASNIVCNIARMRE